MKNIENITIPQIEQKLEVIEIQLKLLFESYRGFISRFLMWENDDPKYQNTNNKNKLAGEFKQIMQSLESYANEIGEYISVVDTIANKVRATRSTSMMKSMEHNLFKIDQVLLRCNTYLFLIDESQFSIAKVFNYTKQTKKRILN